MAGDEITITLIQHPEKYQIRGEVQQIICTGLPQRNSQAGGLCTGRPLTDADKIRPADGHWLLVL